MDVGDCYPAVERTGVNIVDKAEGLLCGLIVIDLVVLPPLEKDENEKRIDRNLVLDDIDPTAPVDLDFEVGLEWLVKLLTRFISMAKSSSIFGPFL